ncbi:hypothetical protein [Alloalcanivorax xenomutans]|jgi:hypothetical protein|uniref:Secreted protein n=1 Tax=Alloalcanivorax xenomutans TaxID=1094342 RepID=A0A9Q3W4L5_9GAMM|nr:hypothetical protein [Alloalcanivorax xenomutans]MCE7508459.1 hypothetical protein [Alloalcanivorax xenomutans]MCE7521826.1 hypothetical protein [Alloalcanivorax xenomutans]
MNIKTFKPMMLALAGAVALTGFSSANAAEQYVVYKGNTLLETPSGQQAGCWLTIAGTVDDTGVVTVKAAGARPGDYPTCSGIYLGNIAWTGTMSNTSGAGTIALNTSASIPGAPSTVVPSTGESCGGTVTGISYPGVVTVGGVNIPTSVHITGVSNYGGNCTINTSDPAGLDLKAP